MNDIKLIISDLDGTLLNEEKLVSDATKQAIEACKNKGIYFGIATGRPLEPSLELVQEWGIDDLCDFVLAMNGAELFDCKKKEKTCFFQIEPSVVKGIMDHFSNMKVRFYIFEDNTRYVNYSDEETKKKYPFDFHYEVAYTLEDNQLTIAYRITNTGTEEMPFTFGLHPGFNCPLCEGESFEDYTLRFDHTEKMKQLIFDGEKKKPYALADVELDHIPCSYDLIEKYLTLIYKGAKSSHLTLSGPKGHGVKISITGYPYLAIWTAKRGAPFICLEPWYGHADFSEVKEDFYHREGTMILSPSKTFTTAYTIQVF